MAQTLWPPRAYVITPGAWQTPIYPVPGLFYNGGPELQRGDFPSTGATGIYHVPVLSYYHSFSLFGPLGQNFKYKNYRFLLPYVPWAPSEARSLGTSDSEFIALGLLDVALPFLSR